MTLKYGEIVLERRKERSTGQQYQPRPNLRLRGDGCSGQSRFQASSPPHGPTPPRSGRIHPGSWPRSRVPAAADRSHGHSSHQQPGGGEVPEIVKPHRVETRPLAEPDEGLGHVVRHPGPRSIRIAAPG